MQESHLKVNSIRFSAEANSVMTRASFCCSKKLKKLHLFLTKVAKCCIYAQILKTTGIYSKDLFTYNAVYLQILLREKWRSFANSLRSMLQNRGGNLRPATYLRHYDN